MTAKYKNKYRIASARLQSWDYSSNGAYFITICTARRKHYFGEIRGGKMYLSEIGKKAREYWLEIPNHYPFVKLDEFIVMPDHIHGIIVIDKPIQTGHAVETRHAVETGHAPSVSQNTISDMVGSFKSSLTKWCNENKLPFRWQSRFHDHIIRGNNELQRIRNYIINNPANW